jgi:predicted phage terminase large subunit-like protein
MVIPWDLAYSQTDRADYTVGLPTRIVGGRFYVVDKVRGRYNEDELPAVIAVTIFKWMPDRVAIENSQGAKWLKNEIRKEMEKLGCDEVPIEYVDIGQGVWRRNEVNAGPVVRLLGDGRLLFSLAIPKIDEIYDELEAFPNPNHKDDIVAALNLAVNHFMTTAELTVQEAHVPSQMNSEHDHLRHEQIYGYGRYPRMLQESPPPVEDRGAYALLPNILGELPE